MHTDGTSRNGLHTPTLRGQISNLLALLLDCYNVDMSGEMALSILQRLVESQRGELSPPAAEAVLQLQLADFDQARMNELASKSNDGFLHRQKLTNTSLPPIGFLSGRQRRAWLSNITRRRLDCN